MSDSKFYFSYSKVSKGQEYMLAFDPTVWNLTLLKTDAHIMPSAYRKKSIMLQKQLEIFIVFITKIL